ncbi:APC family permease [Kocuria salsicia]|uniref:APC family permease n=2 Tax=Micrococcaceae TaxID=1268 RepID=UPI0021B5FC21|nr:APC family permease [Kocuria salsicia]
MSRTSLHKSMGVPTLVYFGLSYMVPMTVFTTYGIVNEITGGFLSTAYLLTLFAMLFTACSYAFMGRAVQSAGSAYAYTRVGLGSAVGFVTGWTVMIDYILLPMLNYLLIGLYLAERFPAVPAWAFSLAALALVTVLNIVGVAAVKSANVVLVLLQVVFFIIFFVYAARAFDPSVHPLDPFIRSDLDISGIAAGAAVLCLSFLGFDAVSTMSEEAKDAKHSIPRAVILTTVIGGLFFVAVAWFAHMAAPEVETGAAADVAAVTLLSQIGGNLLTAFFLAAYVTGALGSALASQASVSRILYAMGRDHLLPHKFFGTLSPRFRTPAGAILLVAVISVSAVFADVDFVASIVSFGALTAFSMVNLSVISTYLVRAERRTVSTYLLYGAVPTVGFALTAWLWTSLAPHTVLLGLGWVALGIIRLLWHTRMFTRPVPRMHLTE